MVAPFWRWSLMAAFACVWAVCDCLSLCIAHTTECMNIKTPVRLASSGHRSGGTALGFTPPSGPI